MMNSLFGTGKCGAACVSSISAQATILTPRLLYVHRNSTTNIIESIEKTHRKSSRSCIVAAQHRQWDATTSTDATHSRVARLAVFVSGGGSNFKAIYASILAGSIEGEVVAVVTNAPSCGGAEYARQHGIDVLMYPPTRRGDESLGGIDDENLAIVGENSPPATRVDGSSSTSSIQSSGPLSTSGLTEALHQEYKVDFIILAGYMKLIPSQLVQRFPRAILNIHPGLLPSFGGKGYYGSRVHRAVISSGARFSGPTVHFIDEEYDTGPILAQAVVPVYPTDSPDTLAARVLQQEHQLYPRCVAALCSGRVSWREDGIPYMYEAL
eukprot:jgi/Picsp_1/1817/NSC_05284-R1_phosphoribosylglycinamide formyltransferase